MCNIKIFQCQILRVKSLLPNSTPHKKSINYIKVNNYIKIYCNNTINMNSNHHHIRHQVKTLSFSEFHFNLTLWFSIMFYAIIELASFTNS